MPGAKGLLKGLRIKCHASAQPTIESDEGTPSGRARVGEARNVTQRLPDCAPPLLVDVYRQWRLPSLNDRSSDGFGRCLCRDVRHTLTDAIEKHVAGGRN